MINSIRFIMVAGISTLLLSSCHEAHQKIAETFNGKDSSTATMAKDQKEETSIDYTQLTPSEEQDEASGATSWENAGISDVKGLKLFIKKLKYWADKDMKDSIAANIEFPLLNDNSISSAAIFLQKYSTLFNTKVKNALAEQELNKLFRNANGVMVGNGEIWIANVAESGADVYRITSVNYK